MDKGKWTVKFRCERDVLVDALAAAGRAVSARGSLPVLSGLLLELQGDELRVTGSDRDLTISVHATVAGQDDGRAVFPGKLYDYARKLAVNLHSCVNASAQYAGLAALTGPQDEVDKMVAEFDRRRKVVVEGLNKLPGVSCVVPKGAFYAFPNIKRTGWKAKELANTLLNDTGVVTIGGPDFGILGEGYLRLSYANSTENILKALHRMGDFLSTRKAA